MKIFKINENLEIVCEWKKTRIAFKHEATLLQNGKEIEKAKICYLNRTWESFEFQSVIKDLLEKTDLLTDKEKEDFMQKADGITRKETDKQFGMIGAIAKMTEIFGQTKKEKNDLKTKMIKAGLENQGLIMPDDWNELTEDVKESRLNAVINQLSPVK